MSDVIAADQLRLFIERIERLEEEKKGLADDIRDVYSEAKATGFDTKTMREIVKLRRMSVEDRREREALIDTYKAALGMLDGTPLGRWALERLEKKDAEAAPEPAEVTPAEEELYAAAVAKVTESQRASTSWLQRQLKIGFNPAARLIERMEREGIVSAPNAAGARDVLRNSAGEAVPPPPEPTVEEARALGGEAAKGGQPVTSNPFPARDPRRAAWDEAWCAALGSDGMEIPDALKPTPKPKKGGGPGDAPEDEAK